MLEGICIFGHDSDTIKMSVVKRPTIESVVKKIESPDPNLVHWLESGARDAQDILWDVVQFYYSDEHDKDKVIDDLFNKDLLKDEPEAYELLKSLWDSEPGYLNRLLLFPPNEDDINFINQTAVALSMWIRKGTMGSVRDMRYQFKARRKAMRPMPKVGALKHVSRDEQWRYQAAVFAYKIILRNLQQLYREVTQVIGDGVIEPMFWKNTISEWTVALRQLLYAEFTQNIDSEEWRQLSVLGAESDTYNKIFGSHIFYKATTLQRIADWARFRSTDSRMYPYEDPTFAEKLFRDLQNDIDNMLTEISKLNLNKSQQRKLSAILKNVDPWKKAIMRSTTIVSRKGIRMRCDACLRDIAEHQCGNCKNGVYCGQSCQMSDPCCWK